MARKLFKITPVLNGTTLTAIELAFSNSDTPETPESVTITATNLAGVFTNPDWENTPLAMLVQTGAFSIQPLTQRTNGTVVGLHLNVKNFVDCLPATEDPTPYLDIDRHVCITRQATMTPALQYAQGIDLKSYTPAKCGLCKSCTHKRRCYFYKNSDVA